MKCMKCGAELQENEKICRVCGQETETVETNALKEETKGTSATTDGLAASEQAVSRKSGAREKEVRENDDRCGCGSGSSGNWNCSSTAADGGSEKNGDGSFRKRKF